VQQKRDEIRTYFHQPIGDRRKEKRQAMLSAEPGNFGACI